MNFEIRQQVKAHALKDAPNEACGFVVVNNLGKAFAMPCENEARDKVNKFSINPVKNLEAEKAGTVVGFYHSHASEFLKPETENFSREDLDISYESGLPALLYAHPNDTWKLNVPSTYTPAPLLGRPFVWGIWDCYTLVRDYFLIHKKVVLGSYFTPEGASVKSDFGYEEFHKREPFHEVSLSDARKGDVILIAINSKFINHCLIYQGNNEFLHQPALKISSIGILDDRLQKYVVKTLRYND